MARPNPATPRPFMGVAQSDDLSRRVADSGLIQPNSHPELTADTPLDRITKWVGGLMKPKTAPPPVVKSPSGPPPMSKATEDSLSQKYLGS